MLTTVTAGGALEALVLDLCGEVSVDLGCDSEEGYIA